MNHYDPKYSSLIDEEMWAFIRKSEEDAVSVTADIDEVRLNYVTMCQHFASPYPASVTAEDSVFHSGLKVRHYSNSNANQNRCVAYIHGGGFVVGDLESHDSICADLCDKTGLDFFAFEYRLSPEHKHPAAFEDTLAAFEYLVSTQDKEIILVGDSAGACLAAAVSHHTRNQTKKPIGQVFIYPLLGGDLSQGSYVEHANAPLLSTADVEYYNAIRASDPTQMKQVSYHPLEEGDYAGLPQTIAFGAQCDPLYDDGMVYCERITQCGGSAVFHHEAGMVHGYLRARNSSKKAAASFDKIAKAIAEVGS